MGSLILIIPGQRFGRLTAIQREANSRSEKQRWLFRCDCGNECIIGIHEIRRGDSRSCGCLRAALTGDRFRAHGKARSADYRSWASLIQRCENPKSNGFTNYGARGIKVCDRWQKFNNFYADMGPKPSSNYSIDRIDVNGNYEPNNCRWATKHQQLRNMRKNRFVLVCGRMVTIAEAGELTGISVATIRSRLVRGWSPSEAARSR